MVWFEIKKMLVYRKSYWILITLLIIECIQILGFTRPYDAVLEKNRNIYEEALSKVEGELTEDKRDYLETEMRYLNDVHMKMADLQMSYYRGETEEEDFREEFSSLSEVDERYVGFTKLYNQYIFVREDANRSFLYTGGWEALLNDPKVDLLLTLALILVLSSVFSEEYATGMNCLLCAQPVGPDRTVRIKAVISMGLAALLCLLLEAIRLGYCAGAFGLSGGEYRLCSLVSFGNETKELTLWQGFFLQLILKILGYMETACIILFLSVWMKKYSLVIMTGIVLLILPPLTWQDPFTFRGIPMPWSLCAGNVYLFGGEGELSLLQIALVMAEAVVMMGLILFFLHRKNRNFHGSKGLKFAACLLLMLFATGCGREETTVYYNSDGASFAEADSYMAVMYSDTGYLIQKDDGKISDFPLNARTGENVFSKSGFFLAGEECFYIQSSAIYENSGMPMVRNDVCLMKINLRTLQTEEVFRWNQETGWLFGLIDRNAQTDMNGMWIQKFFIHRQYMYFLRGDGSGEIDRMNLLTGESEVFLNKDIIRFSYDGKSFYYTDDFGRLVIYDLDRDREETLETVVAENFTLAPEGIYFSNMRDGKKLYLYSYDSGEVSKVCEETVFRVYTDESNVWFQTVSGVCGRMNRASGEIEFFEAPGFILAFSKDGDYIYFIDEAEWVIYAMDKSTLEVCGKFEVESPY